MAQSNSSKDLSKKQVKRLALGAAVGLVLVIMFPKLTLAIIGGFLAIAIVLFAVWWANQHDPEQEAGSQGGGHRR